MSGYVSSLTSSYFKDVSPASDEVKSDNASHVSSVTDNNDFQSMVEGDESGESRFSVGGVSGANGVLELVRNVETGKGHMQSALMSAAASPDPDSIFRATAALSKYDLQTLFLSKVANKTFQAVDRLTNLQ